MDITLHLYGHNIALKLITIIDCFCPADPGNPPNFK